MKRAEIERAVKEYVLEQINYTGGREIITRKSLERVPVDEDACPGDRQQIVDDTLKRLIQHIENF